MKLAITKKLAAIALIGLFSQISLADAASAQKTIAGIVAGMNHFANDAQKAQLAAIASDDSSGRGMQMIATAVGGIQHAATAEGKASMDQIIGYDGASAEAKALAKIVMEFNHMASAEAKAELAKL
ncbi:MAG: hypothetical protein HQ498_11790 [Pseudohongiella sp.]|nr:hypothetical protein [Pseudohongiella sp.]